MPKSQELDDDTEVDIDFRVEASWKRNGPSKKQWGPGLGSKCVEEGMGLEDIYKYMRDRIRQLV